MNPKLPATSSERCCPWAIETLPDALIALNGEDRADVSAMFALHRRTDLSAMIEYFEPLLT